MCIVVLLQLNIPPDHPHLEGLTCGKMVFIRSDGGGRQHLHTDYHSRHQNHPFALHREWKDRKVVPVGVVVMLNPDGGKFSFVRGLFGGSEPMVGEESNIEEIWLNYGEAVVFNGSLVHCGSMYENPNYRWHWYVNVEWDGQARDNTFRAPCDGTNLVWDSTCPVCATVHNYATHTHMKLNSRS